MNWVERLTQEKSLFQLYKKARLAAYSAVNVAATISVFAAVVFLLGTNVWFGEPIESYTALVDGVKEIADIGFTFTTAILGFLISGFAIFAGISKPDVLILLAKANHGKHDISELQFIFFNFMLVFIHYLVFMIACVLVKATTFDDGPLGRTVTIIYEADRNAGWAFISVIFALLFAWLIFASLLLKSFIWNLYQAVLITILLEAEMKGMLDEDSE